MYGLTPGHVQPVQFESASQLRSEGAQVSDVPRCAEAGRGTADQRVHERLGDGDRLGLVSWNAGFLLDCGPHR